MSWSIERRDLMLPRFDLKLCGTLRLVSSGGGVIWALLLSNERAHAPDYTPALYAVYWERNALPPEMRFLPVDMDDDGFLRLRPGAHPLPPRAQ